MATMVLTTLGGAVAGPVGAALGRIAGRAVDGAVFGGPARQGPRLRELQVQLSNYGAQIPKLFGTMRVAGTVIWATDLREAAATSGKGAGRTTHYSYSASFAVALSARRIRGIRRIWAEGKLLRGAAGDWKTRTGGFRWYPGDEAQLPDPLIASLVGIGDAPAHRGIAYAVFEDLALADFGNRIPSLTFEVEADAGPVGVGTIVEALGGGAIRAEGAGTLFAGYAASGERVRDAVEAIVEPLGGWYAAAGDDTRLRIGAGAARALPDAILPLDAPAWRRPPHSPVDVAVAYYDIARDYQAGVQQVLRPGGAGRVLRIELPAALEAATAAGIASDVAAREAVLRDVRTIALDWRAIEVAPGERVTLSDEPGLWRVRRTRIEAMAMHRPGEDFVLLDAATLRRIDGMTAGVPTDVMAVGVMDADVATARMVPTGRWLVPPAPVHLSITAERDGAVLRWKRRARLFTPWRDGVDQPLVEEREAYRLNVIDAVGTVRTIELTEPRWNPVDMTGPATIEVRQIGTNGLSPPATLSYSPEMSR